MQTPQTAVIEYLSKSGALNRAVSNGAVVLAICAGMQVLGERFAIAGDGATPVDGPDEDVTMRSGLGLLDVETVRGKGPRRVGELMIRTDSSFGNLKLTGYENHGGVTKLGPGSSSG